MTQLIEKEEVQSVLQGYRGNFHFKSRLEESTLQTITPIIIKYVYFNRLFGAGVANLAAQIARQTDLFNDEEELSELCTDRSMEVASAFFAAAIDEFGDRSLPRHPTHRILAQAVVKGLMTYSGLDSPSLKSQLGYSCAIDQKVCQGYAAKDESQLFTSMGFHLGSELLADKEFRILDEVLRQQYPKLVHYLEDSIVQISGMGIPAYRWIGIHTRVEIDHFDYAVRGANLALRHYSGTHTKNEARENIVEGIRDFAAFQEEFMKSL